MWLIASVAIAAGAEGVVVGTEPSETTFLPILLLLQDDRCNDYSVGRHNAPQNNCRKRPRACFAGWKWLS